MATTSKKKEPSSPYAKLVYAPLGAGQLLIEKTKELPGLVGRVASDPGRIRRTWDSLAERGLALASGIRDAAPTRTAQEQMKSARSRVKAAATSVGKAVDASGEAAKAAAKKVG